MNIHDQPDQRAMKPAAAGPDTGSAPATATVPPGAAAMNE
jgi:hypothetical protein